MTGDGLTQFRAHMDDVVLRARSQHVSSKVQRYVRAYEAGLPQDITVRWFPCDDIPSIEARVHDLVDRNLEVWISQGLPWNPDIDNQFASIEKRTDLLKGLSSVKDFNQQAIPRLKQWDKGSWAKVFYDTPKRSLVSGTIRIDTLQAGAIRNHHP